MEASYFRISVSKCIRLSRRIDIRDIHHVLPDHLVLNFMLVVRRRYNFEAN